MADELADIAQALDARERDLIMQSALASSSPSDTANSDEIMSPELLALLSQPSSNVDNCGNFSIEVLRSAVGQPRFGSLELISMASNHEYVINCYSGGDSSTSGSGDASPHKTGDSAVDFVASREGFIVNEGGHWYAVRKIHGRWWNLNSMAGAEAGDGGASEGSNWGGATEEDLLAQALAASASAAASHSGQLDGRGRAQPRLISEFYLTAFIAQLLEDSRGARTGTGRAGAGRGGSGHSAGATIFVVHGKLPEPQGEFENFQHSPSSSSRSGSSSGSKRWYTVDELIGTAAGGGAEATTAPGNRILGERRTAAATAGTTDTTAPTAGTGGGYSGIDGAMGMSLGDGYGGLGLDHDPELAAAIAMSLSEAEAAAAAAAAETPAA